MIMIIKDYFHNYDDYRVYFDNHDDDKVSNHNRDDEKRYKSY